MTYTVTKRIEITFDFVAEVAANNKSDAGRIAMRIFHQQAVYRQFNRELERLKRLGRSQNVGGSHSHLA